MASGVISTVFCTLVVATMAGVPLYAFAARGRTYAIFAVVILGASLPGAAVTHARLLGWLAPPAGTLVSAVFAYGTAAAALHLAALVQPRLRRPAFRLAISIPGMAFVAAGFLAGLSLLALLPVRAALALSGWTDALATMRWLDIAPFAVVAASLVTSARLVEEVVRVPLAPNGAGAPSTAIAVPAGNGNGNAGPPRLVRLPAARYRRREPAPLAARPLRLVQIADPHLGPWQPVRKLAALVERLAAREPDLVLLTGDFLTMEGSGTPGALARALAPLERLAGRCFAILGNHDHGCRDEVEGALAANRVRLLVDAEALAETDVGPVQIVGANYVGRGRRAHIRALLASFPRRPGHLRLLLLHDPSGFRHVPLGDVDLTLSGHTHGGQLGLVSFGLDWTILTRTRWPDHGLFGHGPNRLYVHRGTGFYGFPLRIGVPGEASVLELLRS